MLQVLILLNKLKTQEWKCLRDEVEHVSVWVPRAKKRRDAQHWDVMVPLRCYQKPKLVSEREVARPWKGGASFRMAGLVRPIRTVEAIAGPGPGCSNEDVSYIQV